MARGDELLKNTGQRPARSSVRLHSVIPGLTRNPCSSERDGGRPSGNFTSPCHPPDPSDDTIRPGPVVPLQQRALWRVQPRGSKGSCSGSRQDRL